MNTDQPTPDASPPTRRVQRARLAALGGLVAVVLVGLLVFISMTVGKTASIAPASATASAAAQASASAASADSTAVAAAAATDVAGATATAVAFTDLLHSGRVIYQAPVPGPGCDHGGAQWATNSPPNVTCLSNGLRLTGNSTEHALTTALCERLPSGDFPAHYEIGVDVAGIAGSSAVEIAMFGPAPGGRVGGHTLNLYPSSYLIPGPNGQPIQGPLSAGGTTSVLIAATDQQTYFLFNGVLAGTYVGAPSPIDTIILGVYSTDSSSNVQATFSNFTVSALP